MEESSFDGVAELKKEIEEKVATIHKLVLEVMDCVDCDGR